MAEKRLAKKAVRKSSNSADRTAKGFSAEERAAMRDRATELKVEGRGRARAAKPDLEQEVLAKIAEMPPSERAMAKRIHEIVKDSAPSLSPRTWYGMPAYANAAGKVICFFTSADKFKTRYATFGFNEKATLDDGNMWPTSFALTALTPATEAKIAALVKKAVR